MQASGTNQTISTIHKIFLLCGLLSSLLYVGTDILASNLWVGYDYVSQAFSELNAIGAPTRAMVLSLLTVYNVLDIAFGAGVLFSAGKKRSLRLTGIFIILNGAAGLLLPFFPMHVRGEVSTNDFGHIILTIITVLIIFLTLGFGAAGNGKPFCFYSIATILICLIFGIWAGMDSSNVAANLPTPWLGIKERINIYSYLLWMIVLAVYLLRPRESQAKSGVPEQAILR